MSQEPQAPRFQSGGTVREGSIYVERAADAELYAALAEGEFCYVLAPRQIGKSSLRVRSDRRLVASGARTAAIDLTRLGGGEVAPEQWYYGLVDEVARGLGIEADPADFWTKNELLAPVHRFSRYLRDEVLERIAQPVVIFIDEIDAVLTLSFPRDDFFAAVRAAYNARVDDAAYRRLAFCLLGVAAPSDLIEDAVRTPFNIGRGVRLEDFTRAEAEGLRAGLRPLGAEAGALLDEVYAWTGGHPYMTQRVCEALAQRPAETGTPAARVGRLVDELFLRRGIVEDANLAYAAKRFDKDHPGAPVAHKLHLYRRLLQGERVPTEAESRAQMELRLTGMAAVRSDDKGDHLAVRSRIFARVFDVAWVHEREGERLVAEPLARWLASGRRREHLLRGTDLKRALAWASLRKDLDADENEFLRAGVEERGRTRVFQAVSAALAAVVVALALGLALAVVALDKADQARAEAEQARLDLRELAEKERVARVAYQKALFEADQARKSAEGIADKGLEEQEARWDAEKKYMVAQDARDRALRGMDAVGKAAQLEHDALVAVRKALAETTAERDRLQLQASNGRSELASCTERLLRAEEEVTRNVVETNAANRAEAPAIPRLRDPVNSAGSRSPERPVRTGTNSTPRVPAQPRPR